MTPLVRSASLTNYAALASAAGLDPVAMLESVGLDPACLHNPDLKISGTATGMLLEKSAQLSGWQDFGLRLAETRQFPVLGPLALLVREQATLRQAMEVLMRYMQLHNESLHLWLQEDGLTVQIQLEYLGRGSSPVRQAMELSMAMLFRLLKQALPENWRARSICFMHCAPSDTRAARRVFSQPVQYGADFNGIVCMASDLALPLTTYSRLDKYVQQYVESVAANAGQSSTEKVRQLVLTLLPSGKCTLADIAGHLGVDERTVRRHLLREGHSYNALLSEVRRELVQRYLAGPPRKHAEIALLLGFSGSSSFSRWFRTQFGRAASDCEVAADEEGHAGI
ncbi:AraC family transcriptional regulator ligand-binding domain-containing protein [Cupriavidus sp. NPDC089707]|uniref:AraC family transcriptional regulator n=1 Tax=Cupriavidus sp. NPDC089707 TaxID=3363963 RepID=UPI00381D0D24